MEDLRSYNLLLVGGTEDKAYFKNYFNQIYLVRNNNEAFSFYSMYKPLIIFFYCDKRVFDTLSVIKKIREYDRETILVIILEGKERESLLEALSLHLSGYMEKPFDKYSVEKVLKNVFHDLNLLNECRVKLKDNYVFDKNESILYNEEKREVKLTKNELKLMTLMSNSKGKYTSFEQIEYTIWEENSAFEDCQTRLKALLYGLRKKLPKDTIVNSYSLGYKLICS